MHNGWQRDAPDLPTLPAGDAAIIILTGFATPAARAGTQGTPVTQPRNLFRPLPDASSGECFDDLLKRPGCRLERIVSQGQASPPGFWYDQNWDEWVLLLTGSATLRLASQPAPITLTPGDHLLIPAGERHRVEATQAEPATVWLALHVGEGQTAPPQ